jgi:hypothetical protein
MASQDYVKGEGFEILGDKEGAKAEDEQRGEPTAQEPSDHHGEDVKGAGFEILDHEEPEPSAEEAGPDRGRQDTEEAASESAGGGPQEQLAPIDVYSVLRLSVAQLAGVAWQKMGLQPDPFTNQIQEDMAQARIAIDAAAALVEKLQPHLHGQEARDYQALLADLRLNFVSHSGGKSETE